MAKRTSLQGKFDVQTFTVLQERIMRRLRTAGREGMKRYDLYSSLGSPVTAKSLNIAIAALIKKGAIIVTTDRTGFPGRPAQVYVATRR